MEKTRVNVQHETQVFLPNDDTDIDEVHHKNHSKKQQQSKQIATSKQTKPKKTESSQVAAVPATETEQPDKNQQKWKSLRTLLLALILLILIGCIIGVILMVVLYPRCPHKANLEWWQKETSYQIEVSNFRDSNGDGIGDIQGVISQLDYLDKLGVKTLILSRALSKETPHKFDSEYAADTSVVDLLKTKLKEKDMHLIIDMPATFLAENDKETISFWLNNYADGLRITHLNDLNSDESAQKALFEKWNKLAEIISKEKSSTKLITTYPKDKKSLKYEKRFLNLSPDQLNDETKFVNDIDSMYKSLSKNEWPVLVIGDYESIRLKNSFGDNKNSRLVHGLLMLLRGTPLLLFGDEIELTGANEYENTMQWNSAEQGCGFTSNSEIGQFFREATNNCANNVQDYTDLIKLYESLAALRKEASIQWGEVKLASSSSQTTTTNNNNVISFVREAKGNDIYLVAANTGDQAVPIDLKEKHGLNNFDTATISLAYSINNNNNNSDDNNQDQVTTVQTNNVEIKSGQLLVLKLKKH